MNPRRTPTEYDVMCRTKKLIEKCLDNTFDPVCQEILNVVKKKD